MRFIFTDPDVKSGLAQLTILNATFGLFKINAKKISYMLCMRFICIDPDVKSGLVQLTILNATFGLFKIEFH